MPAVIATFLVWVGTEAAKAGVKAIAGAAVSKLAGAGVDAALGIEIQGITVEQWSERGKMIVLAAFTMALGPASLIATAVLWSLAGRKSHEKNYLHSLPCRNLLHICHAG